MGKSRRYCSQEYLLKTCIHLRLEGYLIFSWFKIAILKLGKVNLFSCKRRLVVESTFKKFKQTFCSRITYYRTTELEPMVICTWTLKTQKSIYWTPFSTIPRQMALTSLSFTWLNLKSFLKNVFSSNIIGIKSKLMEMNLYRCLKTWFCYRLKEPKIQKWPRSNVNLRIFWMKKVIQFRKNWFHCLISNIWTWIRDLKI